MATSSGEQNFSTPNYITSAGSTSYEITGLSSGSTYYFVVRACDEVGNIDTNTVELSETVFNNYSEVILSETGLISYWRLGESGGSTAIDSKGSFNGTYSNIRIQVLNDDKLAVKLHCRVKAAFASNGRPIVLYDGKQDLMLRRAAGTVWKICAIDD